MLNDEDERRVRRPYYGSACGCGLWWVVGCCCIVLLVLIGLGIAFFVTNNNGGTTPAAARGLTRTSPRNPRAARAAGFHVQQVGVFTRCSGFVDLDEAEQPQLPNTACVSGVSGECFAPGVCQVSFFPAGSTSDARPSTFRCTVSSTNVCTAQDPGLSCNCPIIPASCARQPIGSAPLIFECTEPLQCPAFEDLALEDQPILPDEDCDRSGQTAIGTCALDGQCRVLVQTVGSRNPSTPPTSIDLPPTVAPCANPCMAFVPVCVRCTSPGQCATPEAGNQFLCAAASQVPGGTSRTAQHSLLVLLSVAASWYALV